MFHLTRKVELKSIHYVKEKYKRVLHTHNDHSMCEYCGIHVGNYQVSPPKVKTAVNSHLHVAMVSSNRHSSLQVAMPLIPSIAKICYAKLSRP